MWSIPRTRLSLLPFAYHWITSFNPLAPLPFLDAKASLQLFHTFSNPNYAAAPIVTHLSVVPYLQVLNFYTLEKKTFSLAIRRKIGKILLIMQQITVIAYRYFKRVVIEWPQMTTNKYQRPWRRHWDDVTLATCRHPILCRHLFM